MPLPPRRILAPMLVGNQIQQAIHVAARLGIADLLRDGPRAVDRLASRTGPVAAVVAARDFAGVSTVVDVGGGRGELLAAVLKVHPGLRGVLVDPPRVLAAARRTRADAGVADRCTAMAADVFEA